MAGGVKRWLRDQATWRQLHLLHQVPHVRPHFDQTAILIENSTHFAFILSGQQLFFKMTALLLRDESEGD